MNQPTDHARRFEELFRSNHAHVLAYALRRTDPETAEEVVADTFLVCWRRLEDVPSPPLPWLYGVARRCLANRRRSARRHASLISRLSAASARATPDAASENVSDLGSLRAAFAALSGLDRETLQLIGWEKLSVRDAARAAGCSATTFTVRLHRARRRLARKLQESTSVRHQGDVAARCPPLASGVDRSRRLPTRESERPISAESRP